VPLAVDLVAVAPPDLGSLEVALGDQVGDDPLRGSFRDAHLFGDVACAGITVSRDAQQHVRMVAQEDPGWLARRRLSYRKLLSRLV
jgi:hypothetical protein